MNSEQEERFQLEMTERGIHHDLWCDYEDEWLAEQEEFDKSYLIGKLKGKLWNIENGLIKSYKKELIETINEVIGELE